MLMNNPQTMQEMLGTVLSALIVVFSLAGLTMHSDFYAGVRRRDYWAYYTNQSNLLVFAYFVLLSPVLYTASSLHPLIPHAEYAVMLCILLTHLVFHFLLSPFWDQKTPYSIPCSNPRLARADSIVQHYIVPLLVFVYWLLCSPDKHRLQISDAFLWLIFPWSYALFIMIRARLRGAISHTASAYPYPFLDVTLLGSRRVLYCCVLFSCAGASLAWIGVFCTNLVLIS